VDSCLHHCGGSDVYRNDNLTQAKALQLWYEHGSGALPENGRIFSSSTDYPCSACCTGKQPQRVPLNSTSEQHTSPSDSLMQRPQDWQAVMDAIDAFALVPNCHVVIGNATGELFAYQKGNVGEDTHMRLYSATKWVSGVTIMAMVEDGTLQLDDLASAYLPYWTTDPEDSRARVTLRHLLGFVSGFSGGSSCSGLDTSACTRLRYETASHTAEPGDRYVYNEVHINMASGIAVAASGGVPFAELMQRYVFDRVPGGMPQTRFANQLNPAAGAGLTSTPRDYAQFLRAYFLHSLVSEAGRAEMEADQYPQAQRSAADGGWHYGSPLAQSIHEFACILLLLVSSL
jgi:CubicO group peptidase (beta-lactamase class C family)